MSRRLLITVNRGVVGTETDRKVWSQHALFDLGVTVARDQFFSSLQNVIIWLSAACAAPGWGCFPFSPSNRALLSQMILTVYLSDGEQAVTEVPITPETTCRDVVEFCKEPGESGCHLAEVWRGNGKRREQRQLCGSERCRATTVHCAVTADPSLRPSDLLPSQMC